ncbi:Desert hedgehog protein [Seminavis robusta]|uniref:Desert hedgehog protein n=1 Tax=Seminavis robusta TaxID=568900 RepID=A0A9N8F102_9STRA|nr:Desert hedgehog protein [Seminavis robusta]|eukprot:Sro3842_g351390.1 Desert hedgehog protein (271) ;mRNA; f:2167-3086
MSAPPDILRPSTRPGATSPCATLEVGAPVTAIQPSPLSPSSAFGHTPNRHVLATFVELFVESSKRALQMTGNHMVYVHGKSNPVRADSIQVGDSLLGKNNEPLKVTKIRETQKKGIYAPLTKSGTIVVDNILASNYISLQDNAAEYVELSFLPKVLSHHALSHLWMAPFRLLCSTTSTQFCESVNENGLSQYAAFGFQFAEWGQSQNILVQIPFLIATVVVLALFALMEVVVGLPMTSLALLASGVGLSYMTRGLHASFTIGASTKQKVA